MRQLRLAAVLGVLATSAVFAQAKPDFSGTWVFDPAQSGPAGGSGGARTAVVSGGGGAGGGGGMVSGGGGGVAVAGGGGGGGAMVSRGEGTGGGVRTVNSTPPEILVAQSGTSLTIERTTPQGVQKYVHTFDGKENVNVNGRNTLRTRSRWEGGSLVTEGTQVFSSDSGEMTMAIREVRSIGADGSLVVEAERTMDGNRSASKQVYKRK